jgi:hypothetical protein
MGLEDVPRCQHVKTNGTQCGSPALRRRKFCYFHDRVRRERERIAANKSLMLRRFDLPLLEDANSVQMALMKVIQMLGSGELEHKTAGLMLYALQTASSNLRYTEFEVEEVTDVVIDRDTVPATCINGQQWFEEDFAEQTDEEGEAEAEEETEEKSAADTADKELSTEEVRKQVQGVVRNWLLEKVAQKAQ